jgi:hypothetical protein
MQWLIDLNRFEKAGSGAFIPVSYKESELSSAFKHLAGEGGPFVRRRVRPAADARVAESESCLQPFADKIFLRVFDQEAISALQRQSRR